MRRAPVAFCLFAMLALTLVGLTGCEDTPPVREAPQKPRVDLFIYKGSDAYVALVAAALRDALADVTLAEHDAKGDALRQNEQLAQALDERPAVMLVNLVDPKNAAPLLQKARKAGVPIVFFNRDPDANVLKEYPDAIYVGTRPTDAGIMQGELIAKLWQAHPEYDRNKDGKAQYIMFQGDPDNLEALSRTEYSVKAAGEHGVDMRQLGGTYVCNWDGPAAQKSMESALSVYGDALELIIANNDAMALGAIATLAAHGINTGRKGDLFIPVVGVDATPQAIEAISKGVMSATVRQDSGAMAQAVVALARNMLAGKAPLADTPYTADASGVAVRIPYAPYMGEEAATPPAQNAKTRE